MATLAKVPALLLDSSHRSDALAKQEGLRRSLRPRVLCKTDTLNNMTLVMPWGMWYSGSVDARSSLINEVSEPAGFQHQPPFQLIVYFMFRAPHHKLCLGHSLGSPPATKPSVDGRTPRTLLSGSSNLMT